MKVRWQWLNQSQTVVHHMTEYSILIGQLWEYWAVIGYSAVQSADRPPLSLAPPTRAETRAVTTTEFPVTWGLHLWNIFTRLVNKEILHSDWSIQKYCILIGQHRNTEFWLVVTHLESEHAQVLANPRHHSLLQVAQLGAPPRPLSLQLLSCSQQLFTSSANLRLKYFTS